jgi:hypothetical protein
LKCENSILSLALLRTVLTTYLEIGTILLGQEANTFQFLGRRFVGSKCGIQWLPVILRLSPEKGISDDKAIRFNEFLLIKQEESEEL